MDSDITALILTKNEELHIERCIDSIKDLVSNIYVIDSGSTDNTRLICEKHQVNFFVNPFYNYSSQLNYGLKILLENNCDWVLSIDADEFFTPKLIKEINNTFDKDIDQFSGLAFTRKVIFHGKILNFGGISSRQLRLFRAKEGYCERHFMDEHIKVKGKIKNLNYPFFDCCLKDLSWWTAKHNLYSNREIVDMLFIIDNEKNSNKSLPIGAKIKRKIKIYIYCKMPIIIRAFLYFLVRYLFLLGFLDGIKGLIYYFLQGFWYRFLIDAKILELKEYAKRNNLTLEESIKPVLGIDISKFD